MSDTKNMKIPEAAIEAAHRAICEESLAGCVEWEGRCVQAVQAIEQHVIWIGESK